MGIPGLMMTNRAQSADGRIQRESAAAEDSEEETPPVRQPNTIGDLGVDSPTAMTNLRRVWNQILWTRQTCTPYITVTDMDADPRSSWLWSLAATLAGLAAVLVLTLLPVYFLLGGVTPGSAAVVVGAAAAGLFIYRSASWWVAVARVVAVLFGLFCALRYKVLTRLN